MSATEKKAPTTLRQGLLLIGFGLAIGLALCELGIRFIHLDIRLLRPILFYQCADLEVHQPSSDPQLIYELKPHSKIAVKGANGVHPKEPLYKVRHTSVDEKGFRSNGSKPSESPQITIVFTGNSNTYGALVGDSETYPAYIEKKLNQIKPGYARVINAGRCAYTLSQKTHLATKLAQELKPQVLFIENSHRGRRAILKNQDVIPVFTRNPVLFRENIPNFRLGLIPPDHWHYSLIDLSAIYRVLITASNQMHLGDFRIKKVLGFEVKQPTIVADDTIESQILNSYAEYINRTTTEMLQKTWKDIAPQTALYYLDPTSDFNCEEGTVKKLYEMDTLSICRSNHPKEFYRTHPPSYVYEFYAEQILKFLKKKGHI